MRVIERSAHSPCCRIWPPFDCEENCFGGRGGRYLVVKVPALSAAESQTTWSGSKQDQASPERNVCGQKSYINVEPRVLKKKSGVLEKQPLRFHKYIRESRAPVAFVWWIKFKIFFFFPISHGQRRSYTRPMWCSLCYMVSRQAFVGHFTLIPCLPSAPNTQGVDAPLKSLVPNVLFGRYRAGIKKEMLDRVNDAIVWSYLGYQWPRLVDSLRWSLTQAGFTLLRKLRCYHLIRRTISHHTLRGICMRGAKEWVVYISRHAPWAPAESFLDKHWLHSVFMHSPVLCAKRGTVPPRELCHNSADPLWHQARHDADGT